MTYLDMIIAAIADLKDRTGSSNIAISRHIRENNDVPENCQQYIRAGIRKGLDDGMLVKVKGSFKLSDAAKAAIVKKAKTTTTTTKVVKKSKPAAKAAPKKKKAATPKKKKAAPKKKAATPKKKKPSKK
eukprot:TRINITY_DN5925_c0_g1_i1.p1 TRINITY_DN5925_c0_g1~~TRINITY_DN5925_c0_g1_i1.p1  ORF type:complete len:146 (-),score=48.49 TRINITY_DN5925_c0_g1_i1:286-672(-)